MHLFVGATQPGRPYVTYRKAGQPMADPYKLAPWGMDLHIVFSLGVIAGDEEIRARLVFECGC